MPTFFVGIETDQTLIDQQQVDPFCRTIIGSLLKKTKSRKAEGMARQYCLIDRILYRRRILNGQQNLQLCVPRGLVAEILVACHDNLTAGHMGIARSIHKISQRYY